MPFTAYYLDPQGNLNTRLREEEVRSAFEARRGVLWVDIGDTTEEDGRFLARVFKFHELAIEDCVSVDIHPPKIDDYGEHLFITIHGIDYSTESDIVETAELSMFLGPHYVVTNHNYPMHGVESLKKTVEDNKTVLARGTDFLAHSLMDAVIESVMPTIDRMSEVVEEVEGQAIRKPQQVTLESALKLKRSAIRLHRVMVPQREVLNRLSRGEFPMVRQEALIFYRDVYDSILRIEDLNQVLMDRADNALSTYLSALAHRQNEVMKILAIVTTVILPMTLLASIYGMNFENIPELKWSWGYYAVLGIMATVGLTALGLLWARHWYSWGRKQAARANLFKVRPDRMMEYVGHWTKKSSD